MLFAVPKAGSNDCCKTLILEQQRLGFVEHLDNSELPEHWSADNQWVGGNRGKDPRPLNARVSQVSSDQSESLAS